MMVYINGFMLGLSLITALGPQNVFLIRQGALKRHAALSALVCFICDVILITASVAGLHHVLIEHPHWRVAITVFGVLFLAYYGYKALKSAYQGPQDDDSHVQSTTSRLQIISMALGFSLLNPHAIIDSLIIIGGGSAQFPGHHQAFLLGVLTASMLWFTSLTLTTRYLAPVLSRVSVWRRIEAGSGILMLGLAIKLACSLL